MNDFQIAFLHAGPHGVLTAVHIPDAPDAVPEDTLARLAPEEADLAREMRGYRQVQFVGGRIALRHACSQLRVTPPPLLSDDRGAPVMPPGLTGSVSHKRTIAVGMVARAAHGTLGVDIEEYEPQRPAVTKRVLMPEEIEAIQDQDPDRRWMSTLIRFSIKESIYKALDPYVKRYVDFQEAFVEPDLRGQATVDLRLKGGEGPFEVDARYDWVHGRLLTSVRIRLAHEAGPALPSQANDPEGEA